MSAKIGGVSGCDGSRRVTAALLTRIGIPTPHVDSLEFIVWTDNGAVLLSLRLNRPFLPPECENASRFNVLPELPRGVGLPRNCSPIRTFFTFVALKSIPMEERHT